MNSSPPPKRRIKIDLSDLADAMETSYLEINHFLDLETGEVVMVTDEARRDLEEIYGEYMEEGSETVDLPAILETLDIPDWQKQALLEADQVEAGYRERYLPIPKAESHLGYQDMQDFAETVSNSNLHWRLERALTGPRPFRAFKDALLSFPAERQAWFAFKKDRLIALALDWLHTEDIEPID